MSREINNSDPDTVLGNILSLVSLFIPEVAIINNVNTKQTIKKCFTASPYGAVFKLSWDISKEKAKQ